MLSGREQEYLYVAAQYRGPSSRARSFNARAGRGSEEANLRRTAAGRTARTGRKAQAYPGTVGGVSGRNEENVGAAGRKGDCDGTESDERETGGDIPREGGQNYRDTGPGRTGKGGNLR